MSAQLSNQQWFNTGVRPINRPIDSLMEHQAWRNGTMQIAFYLESAPPEGSTLAHLAQVPDCYPHQVAIKVTGGGMPSPYAIYNVPVDKR